MLGGLPEDILGGNDLPNKTDYYYEDKRSFEFANKRDFFNCASNTHYSDQLINYAGLRKSQGAVKRVNLDAIGEKEIHSTKLDYHEEATIKTLPYVNYVLFVLYNINDVLLQKGIENKVKDVDNVYNISNINDVGFTDTLKQTVVFRGFMYTYLLTHGFVMGHNTNYDNQNQGNLQFDEDGEPIYQDEDENDGDSTFEGVN